MEIKIKIYRKKFVEKVENILQNYEKPIDGIKEKVYNLDTLQRQYKK